MMSAILWAISIATLLMLVVVAAFCGETFIEGAHATMLAMGLGAAIARLSSEDI